MKNVNNLGMPCPGRVPLRISQEAIYGPPCQDILENKNIPMETRLQILAQYDPGTEYIDHRLL